MGYHILQNWNGFAKKIELSLMLVQKTIFLYEVFSFTDFWDSLQSLFVFFILQLVARFGGRLARPERRSLIKFGGGGAKNRGST